MVRLWAPFPNMPSTALAHMYISPEQMNKTPGQQAHQQHQWKQNSSMKGWETTPPGLMDQANSDWRTASTLECTADLQVYSGCSYKSNTSQEWDFWLDQVPAEKLLCCWGKPALAALAAVVQEGIILTWSHCSISLEKARAVQTKAQFCLCCWGAHFLQNGARCQQTVIS